MAEGNGSGESNRIKNLTYGRDLVDWICRKGSVWGVVGIACPLRGRWFNHEDYAVQGMIVMRDVAGEGQYMMSGPITIYV